MSTYWSHWPSTWGSSVYASPTRTWASPVRYSGTSWSHPWHHSGTWHGNHWGHNHWGHHHWGHRHWGSSWAHPWGSSVYY